MQRKVAGGGNHVALETARLNEIEHYSGAGMPARAVKQGVACLRAAVQHAGDFLWRDDLKHQLHVAQALTLHEHGLQFLERAGRHLVHPGCEAVAAVLQHHACVPDQSVT